MAQTPYRYGRIMLIDDNEIDNFINKKIIEASQFGKEISMNISADVALDAIRENLKKESPELPEVIFVDLNMPVKDGFEFIEEFMQLPEAVKERSRLVVLTSSINPFHKNRALELRQDITYLVKPLTESQLQTI